jgi:hypothetical protein
MRTIFLAALLRTATFPPAIAQTTAPTEIPAGTILPARLNQTLSSKSAKPGQPITARIMQDVPLPNDSKIRKGSTLSGAVLSVEKSSASTNGKIAFRFDKLQTHNATLPIVTNLRAVAGFMDVQDAQTPEFSPGFGTSGRWITTR